MAITRTLISAIPYNLSNKVEKWDLVMRYEQGTEGQADYYTNDKRVTLIAADGDFTAKAESSWTKSELEALCPTSKWDWVFASQYDSVITNSSVDPVADNNYQIPS
tara:strand:- start:248 stop:565 length:318 start_codon:yes stop_codon:yes gene_type:complete